MVVRPCCEPYDKWASRLRLAYSQRKKSARRKKGSGGSAWPTAKAVSGGANTQREARGAADTLTAATSIWQTPKTTAGEYTRDRGNPDHERPTLEGQASTLWATPAPMQTREGWTAEAIEGQRQKEKAKGQNGNGFGIGLAAQATALWKTPDVPNGGRAMPEGMTLTGMKPDGTKGQVGLENQAKLWTTHGRATWKRMAASGGKRRLNPNFVAWLMGWPIGHPSCACSETEWCLWLQHMRGVLSALPTASGAWIWEPPVWKAPEQMNLL